MSIIFNQSGNNNVQIGATGNDEAVVDALKACAIAANNLKEFCQAEWYADLVKALEDMLIKVIENLEEQKKRYREARG